jgi:predicted aspartyl protease
MLENVLLDTGSQRTVLSTDRLSEIGLRFTPTDRFHEVRGVGGVELVVSGRVERLSLGEMSVADFPVEIGGMDYGFEIDGLLGFDFLAQVGAVVDLSRMEVRPGLPGES